MIQVSTEAEERGALAAYITCMKRYVVMNVLPPEFEEKLQEPEREWKRLPQPLRELWLAIARAVIAS